MSENIYLPFLSVVLGYVIALVTQARLLKYGRFILAFSGAFLLAATVAELLPDIFGTNGKRAGAFLLLGVLVQIILEFFSKGAEHGHVHNTSGRKFPVLLFLSLCIHSFLEGMPLQGNTSLVIGISVHKMPIAFILSMFLLNSKYSKRLTFLIVLIFAIMSPLGSLLAEQFFLNENSMQVIKAIVAGIVLHVSTTLILESNENHKFNVAKTAVIIIGGMLGYLL